MTFSKLFNDYVKYMGIRRGCSPVSCVGYETTYTQFVSHVRAQGLTDDVHHFNPDTVESLITEMAGRGLKGSSVNTRLAHLASLGKWGMKYKDGRDRYLLNENPVDRVERPKKMKPKEKYLVRAELRALLLVETNPWETLQGCCGRTHP